MKKKNLPKNEIRKIGFGTVEVSDKAKKYVMEALNNNRLSYGPFLQKFEKEFARLHERKFGISGNSGTSVLQVALAAMKDMHNWKDGDEVLVPSVTFIATSNVVLQNGMKPIFVDVDSKSYNMDPEKVEAKITKKTRAIMPVHLFGLPADMGAIMEIAKKHNLKVLEDSCETVFVPHRGKAVGSHGDIACYSTYAAHIIVTGVGGIALTDNPEYAVAMKSMMNHGRDSIYLSIDDDDKMKSDKDVFQMVTRRFSFTRMGYSYRLTELEGALGLAELEGYKENLGKRSYNGNYLMKKLAKYSKHIQLPSWPKHTDHAFMMFPIVITNPKIKREDLVTYFEKNGIETRYMMPLLNQPYYRKIFGDLEPKYPVAKMINRNGFCIGCHQSLKQDDLDYIVNVFDNFFKDKVSKK